MSLLMPERLYRLLPAFVLKEEHVDRLRAALVDL